MKSLKLGSDAINLHSSLTWPVGECRCWSCDGSAKAYTREINCSRFMVHLFICMCMLFVYLMNGSVSRMQIGLWKLTGPSLYQPCNHLNLLNLVDLYDCTRLCNSLSLSGVNGWSLWLGLMCRLPSAGFTHSLPNHWIWQESLCNLLISVSIICYIWQKFPCRLYDRLYNTQSYAVYGRSCSIICRVVTTFSQHAMGA